MRALVLCVSRSHRHTSVLLSSDCARARPAAALRHHVQFRISLFLKKKNPSLMWCSPAHTKWDILQMNCIFFSEKENEKYTGKSACPPSSVSGLLAGELCLWTLSLKIVTQMDDSPAATILPDHQSIWPMNKQISLLARCNWLYSCHERWWRKWAPV